MTPSTQKLHPLAIISAIFLASSMLLACTWEKELAIFTGQTCPSVTANESCDTNGDSFCCEGKCVKLNENYDKELRRCKESMECAAISLTEFECQKANCTEEQVYCDGACIDPSSSIEFCGAKLGCEGENRGKDCSADRNKEQVCHKGACLVIGCNNGLSQCIDNGSMICADTQTNVEHCGKCGNNCNALGNNKKASCENGMCKFSAKECSEGVLFV